MSRERDEEVLARMPDGMIDQIHLEADAERLIAAVFGEEGYPPNFVTARSGRGRDSRSLGGVFQHAVRVRNIPFCVFSPFGA